MRYLAIAVALPVCVLTIVAASMPAGAVVTCNQQTTLPRPIPLGVSGGNINSFVKFRHQKGCSSGTLGSLVQDQSSNQFILSNNHVLADVNKAKHGELIVQPGLVDTGPYAPRRPVMRSRLSAAPSKLNSGTQKIPSMPLSPLLRQET